MPARDKQRAPHRILGIDPGGHVAGWGLICQTGNKLSLEECGTLRPGSRIEFPERLRRLHQAMGEVIERLQPQAVAIESVFFARHPKAALQLGHVRGVLILAAAERELPIFEYPPATVKKAVTGHGAAKKEQVRDMVNVLLGTRVEGAADKSDALAIAICHAHSGSLLARLKKLDPGPKRRRTTKSVARRSPVRKAK